MQGWNYCSQEGNYRKSVFRASLEMLGSNSLTTTGMACSGCLLPYNLFGPQAILSKIGWWSSSFQTSLLSIQKQSSIPPLHLQPTTKQDGGCIHARHLHVQSHGKAAPTPMFLSQSWAFIRVRSSTAPGSSAGYSHEKHLAFHLLYIWRRNCSCFPRCRFQRDNPHHCCLEIAVTHMKTSPEDHTQMQREAEWQL